MTELHEKTQANNPNHDDLIFNT